MIWNEKIGLFGEQFRKKEALKYEKTKVYGQKQNSVFLFKLPSFGKNTNKLPGSYLLPLSRHAV